MLVLCSGEREVPIGSWPTTQAETSNSLRCVTRVETLPLKGPRLLIRHWILDVEKHTDNIPRLLTVSTSLSTQTYHAMHYPQVLQIRDNQDLYGRCKTKDTVNQPLIMTQPNL